MQDFEAYNEAELNEKKKWLFKESIRIETDKINIEDERKVMEIQKGLLQRQQSKNMLLKNQLENQKNLFDRQWQLLEIETRKLVSEQQKFEQDKLKYKDTIYREARKNMSATVNSKMFFKGVEDTKSLKKRYKELLKIYHPDNMHGDNSLIQAINLEYENLKKIYMWYNPILILEHFPTHSAIMIFFEFCYI